MCYMAYRTTIIVSTQPFIHESSAASTGEYAADIAGRVPNSREAA